MNQDHVKEYWEIRLASDYSFGGVGYLGIGKYYNYWIYRMRKVQFRKALRKINFPKTVKCIDIGSGTGFYIQQLIETGYQTITGSDITSLAVSSLRKKYSNLEILNMDICSTDVSYYQKYELVTCMDVLFHIIDENAYEKAIQNLSSLLEKKGVLIITENFTPSYKLRGHIIDRTKESIIGNLKQNSFQIEYIYSQFVFLNPPVQSKMCWLWKISGWRISLLKRLASSRTKKLAWLVGSILYSLDRLLLWFGVKGKGTSVIICRKIKD